MAKKYDDDVFCVYFTVDGIEYSWAPHEIPALIEMELWEQSAAMGHAISFREMVGYVGQWLPFHYAAAVFCSRRVDEHDKLGPAGVPYESMIRYADIANNVRWRSEFATTTGGGDDDAPKGQAANSDE